MSTSIVIFSIILFVLSGYHVDKVDSFQGLVKLLDKTGKSRLRYSIGSIEKKDVVENSINMITSQFLRPFLDHQSILFSQRSNFEVTERDEEYGYLEEDYEFQENYRRVNNFTFDRSANPNTSMTVSYTIDKLASLLSNPSYLQKYVVPGIYTFLDAEAEPVYIHWSENMIPSIFKKLKEIQIMKKIASNQLNQVRRLSFNTNSEEEVYRKIQNLQISSVKMEIIPKAKLNMIERVTLSLIKRIKPIMNKLLQQNGAEIMAILGQQSPTAAPTTRIQSSPSSSPTTLLSASSDTIKETDKEVISPFQTTSNANIKTTGHKHHHDDDDELELNKENVDKVLDEVRPYLMADGGNVEVVSVNAREGTIELFLQGACGSCPSSTVSQYSMILLLITLIFQIIDNDENGY